VDNVTSRRSVDDKTLLDELGEALRAAGRVPPSFDEASRAAYARRTTGAALARLGYDSLLDDAVHLRDPDAPRIVSFEAGSLTVEIEIADDWLVGQLIPPSSGEVTLVTMHGDAGRALADDAGCFLLPVPPPGPVRFRCRVPQGEVVTDWVRL
jgi:hypothetical protein